METILLSEYLPRVFAMSGYDCREESDAVASDHAKKTGREYSIEIKNSYWDMLQRQKEIGAHLLGLDKLSLDEIAKKLQEFNNGSEHVYQSFEQYASPVSFLLNFFEYDLKGRRILEIGVGEHGTTALGYLATQGASVIGVDCKYMPNLEFCAAHDIEFHLGRWENISDVISKNSIDAVIVQFMHDQPYLGGAFKDIKSFQSHVANELRHVLKNAGVFALRQLDQQERWVAEFDVYTSIFEKSGFKEFEIKIPHEYGDWFSIYQLTK